ncbi:Predicted metalloprotease [Geodermatophilus dictyosporus]|uniref:Predicted metalloprotease n=1 Tax=Geodermatophilus dictyosporus TaxID=1523247 RepID=A0A1I5KW01_9ACTN|nr:neutral zinc metallopeptidase [Geodermatophilus dictyosporus]SFO89068.1 Predicted metalloprotease [Geodermatophilus dictyosporus]
MDLRSRSRGALVVLSALGVLATSGCSYVVIGQPSSQLAPQQSVGDGTVPIVGATDGPIDTLARNALADLETYWAGTFPDVYGEAFPPLTGGYFSVDPNDVDPGAYPEGIGCGTDPRDLENNAFYCSAQGVPNSDSISYDRAFLGQLAAEYGQVLPQLVMAHEFGHAVQGRVGYPQTSIATETQADCLAGAWTAWVADGSAQYAQLDTDDLDQLLRGYFLLRDPVGTGSGEQQAHGSYFDRVSAFQEGFDDGPTACRDRFGPDRVFTQGEFTSDTDFANRGNAPFDDTQDILAASLPEFWSRAFEEVLDGTFTAPALDTFSGSPPGCAGADVALVYCADGGDGDAGLVAYDSGLARDAYELGDFAVVTGVSIPYALAARDQLGLSTGDTGALQSAVCLTGWYSAQVYNQQLSTVTISPGDLDESVQFLLEYGNDPDVLADVELTGFQLVDVFRAGFLQGAGPCDVGA